MEKEPKGIIDELIKGKDESQTVEGGLSLCARVRLHKLLEAARISVLEAVNTKIDKALAANHNLDDTLSDIERAVEDASESLMEAELLLDKQAKQLWKLRGG